MTPEQEHTIKSLIRWLKIREENDIPAPISADQLNTAIYHSSLFPRLLSGKEPLPIPPPLHSGSPWYELVEEGSATNVSLWIQENRPGYNYTVAVINQGPWDLVQRSSDTEVIVRYHPDAPLYRAWLKKPEDPHNGWSIEVYPQEQLDI